MAMGEFRAPPAGMGPLLVTSMAAPIPVRSGLVDSGGACGVWLFLSLGSDSVAQLLPYFQQLQIRAVECSPWEREMPFLCLFIAETPRQRLQVTP